MKIAEIGQYPHWIAQEWIEIAKYQLQSQESTEIGNTHT